MLTSRLVKFDCLIASQCRLLSNSHRILELNNLSNIKGATKKRKRWGRGTGSGRGKLCGHGHQKSLATPRAFEGGQTPHYKLFPKIGFHNAGARDMQIVNLEKIEEFIAKGRLVPQASEMITIRDLMVSGVITKVQDGVKLLAKGKISYPIHLEVSQASSEAIAAVEQAGGTVTCSHFTSLALRALVKPYKFKLYPRRPRPPPKIMSYYLDRTKCGYLSPEIQQRNLALFGSVTSEERYRKEHHAFMEEHRQNVKLRNESLEAAARELVNKHKSEGSPKFRWLDQAWNKESS